MSDSARLRVAVRVVPGARRSEIVAVEPQLRVRLAAPPVEGKANAELVRVLAKALGVRRSAVRVVAGEKSRDKVVEVTGISDLPAGLGPPPTPS